MVKLRSQKILGEQTVIAQKQLARRNRKVLKIATAIWLVFMLCWLPWSIFNLSLNHITPGQIPCGFFLFTGTLLGSFLHHTLLLILWHAFCSVQTTAKVSRDFLSVPIWQHRTKWFHVTCLRNNMLNYFFFIFLFSVLRGDNNEIVVWFFERRPCILQNAMVKKPFSLSNKINPRLCVLVCLSYKTLLLWGILIKF